MRSELLRVVAVAAGLAGAAAAQDLIVYDDQLRNGFQDWSWATRDLADTSAPHSAPNAIRMEPDGWQGLYFHSDAGHDVADYLELRFWVRGVGAGGQQLRVVLQSAGATVAQVDLDAHITGGAIADGVWREVVISFAAIGLAGGSFNELTLQDSSGVDQAPVLLDDLRFVLDPTPPGPVSVAVDPALDRRPISAHLFGVNFATAQQLADIGYTVNRWGGNRTSRYNWQLDVDSSAGDWFFTNYTASEPAPPLPVGSAADGFVLDSRAAGAEVVLTLPTLGRVAGPDRARRWSFSQQMPPLGYGPQTSDECRYFGPDPDNWPEWCNPDAGNGECNPAVNTTGFCSAGGRIVGNDPDDTSIVVGTPFLADWVAFVASRAGAADAGGVRFLALDNEPMLWNSTHRDVHPAAPTYDEIWTKGQAVAAAARAVDPAAAILGPDTWGWCDLWTSAADAPGDCTDGPDRQAHGGTPFVEWYLAQVCAHQQQTGERLVDYVDVHWYPQAAGVAGTDNVVNEGVAASRLRALREELFVLLFNKDDEARQVDGTIAAAVTGAGALWRFDASNPLAPAGSLPVAAGAFSIALPARSATLARRALASAGLFRDDFESGSAWSWSAQAP